MARASKTQRLWRGASFTIKSGFEAVARSGVVSVGDVMEVPRELSWMLLARERLLELLGELSSSV